MIIFFLTIFLFLSGCSGDPPPDPSETPQSPQVQFARPPSASNVTISTAPPRSDRPGAFSVTFINIGEPAPFWDMVVIGMEAAAEDLNIDLEVLNARGDHLLMIDFAEQLAARTEKPDYLIINNEKLSGSRMLDAVEGAGVSVFMLLNLLEPAQTARYGKPRAPLDFWIGSLTTSNEQAGFDIAAALIAEAQTRGWTPPLPILAISGNRSTPAARLRDEGLKRAINAHPGARLEQLVHSQWNREKSKKQLTGLLHRWPESRLLWAANDPMAFGAMDAAIAHGKKPGEDVLIGGLNWSIEALKLVTSGELVASVGGHFLGGAWALVMLRDYHEGIDFAENGGVEQVFPMGVIDQNNASIFLKHFSDRDWQKVDFSKFSMHHNKNIKRQNHYTFTLDAILKQLN